MYVTKGNCAVDRLLKILFQFKDSPKRTFNFPGKRE